jgi:hypothetical protein
LTDLEIRRQDDPQEVFLRIARDDISELVQRPNLFVKIPGTEAGLESIEETIADGIPVNVTPSSPIRATSSCSAVRVGRARRGRRQPSALSVGLDLDQESRLPERDVRRGADRARDRQHHAPGETIDAFEDHGRAQRTLDLVAG